MFKSKYSTILTILLIILIIAIIITVIVLGVRTYRNYRNEKDSKAFAQTLLSDNSDNSSSNNSDEDADFSGEIEEISNATNNSSTENNSVASNLPKVKFYKTYPTVGTINIPKTNVSYPILLDTSSQALEIAVGVTYPSSPAINQSGNVVIIGHNYRNGKFFSNNKNLKTGDIIRITDLEGKTLSYTIYEIFETTPTDTAYMTRNTEGRIEISLSTCTDDGNNRLIILARVEE